MKYDLDANVVRQLNDESRVAANSDSESVVPLADFDGQFIIFDCILAPVEGNAGETGVVGAMNLSVLAAHGLLVTQNQEPVSSARGVPRSEGVSDDDAIDSLF
jgi:hypothetical protein